MAVTTKHHYIFWLSILVTLLIFLGAVSSILLPFIVGVLTAYLLDPVADYFEKYVSRGVATLIVLGLFFALVGLFLLLLVPALYTELRGLIDDIPSYINQFKESKQDWIVQLKELWGQYNPFANSEEKANVSSDVSSSVIKATGSILHTIFVSGLGLVNVVSLIFISPIVAFYLLRDWDRIMEKLSTLIPRKKKKTVLDLLEQMDNSISAYLRGMLIVCIILATYYGTGLALVGLNYGMLIGVMIGVLCFLPYVGAAIGIASAFVVAFFQYGTNWEELGLVAAVLFTGQFIEGNFITPRVLGDKVGLHPAWIMFALLAGGALMGFLGVIMAVPVAAMLAVLVRFGIQRYKQSTFFKS